MDRLNERLDARWSMLAIVDTEGRCPVDARCVGLTTSRAAQGMQEYYEEALYRVDPVVGFVSGGGLGSYDSRAIGPAADYRRDAYVRWNEDRMGSAYWRFVQSGGDGMRLGLSLHRTAARGPMSGDDARLFDLLFAHVDNALRMAARPALVDSDAAAVLLDRTGAVVRTTRAAAIVLEEGDAIRMNGVTVRAVDRQAAAQLTRAIRAASCAWTEGGTGGTIRLPRHGRRPLLALVRALPPGGGPLPSLSAATEIRFVDPDPAPGGDAAARWRILFGFTTAEARLATMMLGSGGNLRDVAEGIGIAHSTARNQLASMCAKAEVKGQQQLVGLLTRVGG